jgi:hypothetical protein
MVHPEAGATPDGSRTVVSNVGDGYEQWLLGNVRE